MTCKGVVNGNVVLLDPDAHIPNGATVEVRVVNPVPEAEERASIEARIRAAREWKAQLSPEELRARIEATKGMLAHLPGSVDEFLREKHEDNEREEAKWDARHANRRPPP